MPDPLRLHLDPDTENAFRRFLDEERHAGRFGLESSTLKVPEHTSLFDRLRPYIDTDQGGLKLLELDVHGSKATFSVIPRLETNERTGVKGASVMLGFSLKF